MNRQVQYGVIVVLLGAIGAIITAASVSAQDEQAIPSTVLELLEETGFVDVEVALAETPLTYGTSATYTALPVDLVVTQSESAEVRTVYESLDFAIVRVHSEEDLRLLAANPMVTDIGRSSMVAIAAGQVGDRPISGVDVTGARLHAEGGKLGDDANIAILDSGVDTDHPDLASSLQFEACYLRGVPGLCADGRERQTGPGAAEDDFGHGTAASGIIVGDGNVAPVGIAPKAKLASFKVLNSAGVGAFAEVLAALDFIYQYQPETDVISIGLTSDRIYEGVCDEVAGEPIVAQMAEMVAKLNGRGIVLVAPAGNNGSINGMGFPACVSGVIGVASTDQTPIRQGFSNVSSETVVAAPGRNIRSSAIGSGHALFSGTSFSTPIVAGCALMLGDKGRRDPDWLLERVRSSTLTIGDSPFEIPWLQCYPNCEGHLATQVHAWGQVGTNLDDVIVGSASADVIEAESGDDVVCGFGGNDVLIGSVGDDILDGGSGHDRLFGGEGNDVLDGGAGPDRLHGGVGRDRIFGGSGQDDIFGDQGSDWLYGQTQSDEIFGGPGNDLLDGAEGKDVLFAQGGDDLLLGGVNTDFLHGGAGFDQGDAGRGWDRPTVRGVSGCVSLEIRMSC